MWNQARPKEFQAGQDLPDFIATFTMTEGDIADILAYARSIEGK